MQLAGTSSWRADVLDGASAELALFVRDSIGLEPGDIPRLEGVLPDDAQVLSNIARDRASRQWRSWWDELIAAEFEQHCVLCDPPTFEALTHRPELRAAATASYPAYTTWDRARVEPTPSLTSPFDWALMKQIAEDVAFDRQVDVGAVQAKVLLLPVEGVWWRHESAGCVLCSPNAATDRAASTALLHTAFDSHVRAMSDGS